MKNIFKRKKKETTLTVTAPISGILTSLEDVSDPVFAQEMLGNGFAIVPHENCNTIYAPVTGRISSLPETRQAIIIETPEKTKVLVHIGIDTIDLLGSGFYAFIRENRQVKQGDKLLCFSKQLMQQKGLDSTVMVIFTEGDNPALLKDYGHPVKAGQVLAESQFS